MPLSPCNGTERTVIARAVLVLEQHCQSGPEAQAGAEAEAEAEQRLRQGGYVKWVVQRARRSTTMAALRREMRLQCRWLLRSEPRWLQPMGACAADLAIDGCAAWQQTDGLRRRPAGHKRGEKARRGGRAAKSATRLAAVIRSVSGATYCLCSRWLHTACRE